METLQLAEQKVGEIVVADYRTAEVFKKFGIDFCCGGKKPLAKACADKGLNIAEVEQAIIEKQKNGATTENESEFNQWRLDKLVDYILNRHHKYVNESTPILLEFTTKIARVHGQDHPELMEIKELFFKLAEELHNHMMKEEHVLFPFIKNLAEAKESNVTFLGQRGIQNPISVMEHEHDIAGELMEKIKTLSSNFQFPVNACNSYRFTFQKLKEYEDDLHQHIHLENNILFPKAVELEKELTQ